MPFVPKKQAFNAHINEVVLGVGDKATAIGGQNVLPFHTFDAEIKNAPKIGVELTDFGMEEYTMPGEKELVMVMVTAKLSKQKLLLIAALLVVVVVVLCLCLHGSGNSSETPDTAQEPVAVDVKTNEGRVAFLASFGWEVAEEPVQTQEVRVPTEPNEVFQRYNELQISQGYDLTQYSGKTLRRYVYTVTNYPAADGGPYYATVLVYKNEVAGGDVCSAAQNGVMHSFTMPS